MRKFFLFILIISLSHLTSALAEKVVVFEFTNDFGSDTSSFDGRTYWAWFHVCETKSNWKCDGSA